MIEDESKEKIIVVDKNDNVITNKARDNLDNEEIYRVSALWITNSKGENLLARRHHTKSKHPGKFGPAVAGTVEKGETYKDNIIKESEEELGIKDINPILGPKIKVDNEYHYFIQWYKLKINKKINEFKIQENEVEEIKWFTKKELIKDLNDNPEEFTPSMKEYIKLFL